MVRRPKWALEGRQAKVNTRPRSSPCQGVDKDATRLVESNELFVQAERAAMSQRKTSYFGEGYVLDHNFSACLRAVILSCECCCSPFFCEVVARAFAQVTVQCVHHQCLAQEKLLSSVVSSRMVAELTFGKARSFVW